MMRDFLTISKLTGEVLETLDSPAANEDTCNKKDEKSLALDGSLAYSV